MGSAITPYLKGKQFSNNLSVQISSSYRNIDRISFIEQKCANKTVLHIGFADHVPLIAQKIKDNSWLHGRLLKVSSYCIGVDVDKDAYEYINTNYQYPDLYLHNVIEDAPLSIITENQWDYIVMGEILEHVDNPVSFLTKLHDKYGSCAKNLLVTVPNALDFTNIRMAKNHKEFINSDHRFWFTPYTLAKVGMMSGWNATEIDFCQTFYPAKWYYKWIINKYPAFRETIVMNFQP